MVRLYAVDASGNLYSISANTGTGSGGKPYNNAGGQPVYQKDLSFGNVPLQPGDIIKLQDVNCDGVINDQSYKRSGYTNIPRITYSLSFEAFNFKRI